MPDNIRLKLTIEGNAEELLKMIYLKPEVEVTGASIDVLATEYGSGNKKYRYHTLRGISSFLGELEKSKEGFSELAKADVKRLSYQSRIGRQTEEKLYQIIDDLEQIVLPGKE
jgi:hypothetical protein